MSLYRICSINQIKYSDILGFQKEVVIEDSGQSRHCLQDLAGEKINRLQDRLYY